MNTLTVIKIGGNVIDDPAALHRFLTAFAGLSGAKVLIHGGGKVATQVAEKLGIQTTMVEGRRITDQPMLDVVTMVYGGECYWPDRSGWGHCSGPEATRKRY